MLESVIMVAQSNMLGYRSTSSLSSCIVDKKSSKPFLTELKFWICLQADIWELPKEEADSFHGKLLIKNTVILKIVLKIIQRAFQFKLRWTTVFAKVVWCRFFCEKHITCPQKTCQWLLAVWQLLSLTLLRLLLLTAATKTSSSGLPRILSM